MTSSPDPATSEAVAVPGPADAAGVLARVTGEEAEPVVLEAGYGWGAFAVDTSGPLAVLVRTGADEAIGEAAWLDWLRGVGFPVVELVGTATDDGSPCGLVVRRTDRSFVERIAEAPAEAPDVLRDLGALQARLHRLPTEALAHQLAQMFLRSNAKSCQVVLTVPRAGVHSDDLSLRR